MLPNKRRAMQTTQTEKGTASARTEAENHTCSGRFDITTANTKCKTNTTIRKHPKQNDCPLAAQRARKQVQAIMYFRPPIVNV